MQVYPILPLLIVGAGSILYIFPGMFLKEKSLFGLASVGILCLSAIISILTLNSNIVYSYPLSGLEASPFSQFFSLVFITVAVIVCISSINSIERYQDEYYFLILISTFGMLVVALSNDLIILFIGFEIASLATYALSGFEKRSKLSIEAAMKYFVFGGFSSALLLFGISIVYGYSGSLLISDMVRIIRNPMPYLTLGLVFIVAGLGFKSALVPFHMWAPDTYHGSPSVVSAFLAAGSKKMSFAAMFRILILLTVALKFETYILMAVLAVITMTLGNLAALVQTSVKRMLAYSSIAHAGYITMAFAIFAYAGYNLAIAGGFLHILSHAIATAGAFIGVAAVGGFITDEGDAFVGLGKRKPLMALTMSIMLLSLAGIPPTFGFYSKFVLFLTAIEADLLWLALIALLNSALSLYYYSKVIMKMYWSEKGGYDGQDFINGMERSYLMGMAIVAGSLILLGILPSPVTELCLDAAKAILGTKAFVGV
jgi:NADH-quinone oxidoreductase subunit N